MGRRLRIAVCQCNTTVGDIAGNVERIVETLRTAESAGADVAVFPELTITGYPPEDLVLKPGFVAANRAALDQVAAATTTTAAVVGFVDAGRDLYNAAALCVGGRVAGIVHKRLLPNYGPFDEQRTFAPGVEPHQLFEIAGTPVGITICEDIWSANGPQADLAAGGAEVILNINGSPYHRNKDLTREAMVATRAADVSCAIVYANLVGGQDELVFDGGSFVVDADGSLLARSPQFVSHTTFVDLEVRPVFRKRSIDPRSRAYASALPRTVVSSGPSCNGPAMAPVVAEPLDELTEVYRALVLGLGDYFAKNGFRDAVIGLSGGIDSTLVAALAVDALGAAAVHGVAMPSRWSSDHSVDDATRLAQNLGIDFRLIPIEDSHLAFERTLAAHFEGRPPDLTEENLQSRIRGVILMALSNKFGWLVLTTSNKSESAVGYATLYGDTAGGFSVLKDVPKLLVYELCRWRNEQAGFELIPDHVLTKPPSAELRPDQRDDQSLPPYEVLDPILEAYVEDDRSIDEIVAMGFEHADVARIVRLVDIAEYKRRQTAPGVKISTKAFGKDRRLPITNGYKG